MIDPVDTLRALSEEIEYLADEPVPSLVVVNHDETEILLTGMGRKLQPIVAHEFGRWALFSPKTVLSALSRRSDLKQMREVDLLGKLRDLVADVILCETAPPDRAN